MFKLIIDNRERYIIRHTDVIARIPNTLAQLTVGDYVITYRDNETSPERVFAVFERKTLEDYAASMKDGRSDNKNKLLQLRDETGCKIFYIIEGNAFPAPMAAFARTPYCYIQSSIFHLQVEYDIQIIQTRDTLHTAETLVAFMQSMTNLADSRGAIFKTFHLTPQAHARPLNHDGEITGSGDATNNDIMATLTAPRPRTDNEILRAMWACFKSVTVESASEFMYSLTLADIFCARIDSKTLAAYKTSTGRSLSKRVVESLLRRDSHRDARILAQIPGISESKAKDILKQHSLRQLLSYSAGAISIIKVGISRKNLGELAAENILKYFNLMPVINTEEPNTPVDAPITEPNVPIDAPNAAPKVRAKATKQLPKPRTTRKIKTDVDIGNTPANGDNMAVQPAPKPLPKPPRSAAKKKISGNIKQQPVTMSDEILD
ncbi:DNA repair nuclease [Faustovirus]|nr:DNA repair nuclease [Faustovirus]QJX73932.1 hypothetical protein F-E9_159 [Faustovirus]